MLGAILARQVRHRDVSIAARRFARCPAEVSDHLEVRAHAFVTGAHAFGRHTDDPHPALAAAVDTHLRGFAYEGAGMVAAIADLLSPGRGRHMQGLLAGAGIPYRHLVHVGAGWGLSVSRWARPTTLRQVDPLLRWLALDGRGFHRQYFAPERTLAGLHELADTDVARLLSAGVGRALWFTHGADLQRIAVEIARAPGGLQPSLWSGVGLAACYAGRPDEVDGVELRVLAGSCGPNVGQGVVFALSARAAHGLRCDLGRRRLAAGVGVDADSAADLAERTSADLMRPGAPVSAMVAWRARLAQVCAQPALADSGPEEAPYG